MLFQTYGDRRNPAVLFFHAMGVTGASSEPIARYLQDRYFCILPTSTVYCEGQKYVSKLDVLSRSGFLPALGVDAPGTAPCAYTTGAEPADAIIYVRRAGPVEDRISLRRASGGAEKCSKLEKSGG